MIDADHLRREIVAPALRHIGMWSEAAENLLLGTAAVESRMGTYLRQIGGPALGMVHAMFWKTLTERSIPYDTVTAVPPTTLKMYATGKGTASKSLVLVEAVKRLKYDGYDDNEADALWLADLGARLDGFDRPALPAGHLKALDKLRKPVAA